MINESEKPYSNQDYIEAKLMDLDLDLWSDYCLYYEIREKAD